MDFLKEFTQDITYISSQQVLLKHPLWSHNIGVNIEASNFLIYLENDLNELDLNQITEQIYQQLQNSLLEHGFTDSLNFIYC